MFIKYYFGVFVGFPFLFMWKTKRMKNSSKLNSIGK